MKNTKKIHKGFVDGGVLIIYVPQSYCRSDDKYLGRDAFDMVVFDTIL